MIDPDSLDPFEVLAHLKQLGYQNITAPQLEEFMHDLKKLIKYEQKYYRGMGWRSISELNANSECLSSCGESDIGCSTGKSVDSKTTTSNDLCTDCLLSQSDTASDISQMTSSVSCPSHFISKKKKKFGNGQPISKPQSSFIRPWRLQPPCKVNHFGNINKKDPVQLYHKYKDLWEQQKAPGEKAHSQLRWTIREKMLGQDPHPRPISQASSEGRSRSASFK